MSKVTRIDYAFVESAPTSLELGILYISTQYRAIVHLCLCGCGEKILLNLDPNGWSFNFDGRSISVYDSVGNVGIPCRSHYIIKRNHVTWLRPLAAVDPRAALDAKPVSDARREAPEPSRFARWLPWKRRRRTGR
jgi:hypothetical protein